MAQTRIIYPEKELLQLMYNHLKSKGMFLTIALSSTYREKKY